MTTVFIWNNNHGRQTYPGHASLALANEWVDHESYVSWVPDGEGEGRCLRGIVDDLQFEGYAPDHIIEIAVTEAATTKMQATWKGIYRKPMGHYNYVRKNCSTIASRVLLSSGIKAGPLVSHNLIWTPLKVKRLALDMGGQERTWEWLLGRSGMLLSGGEREMLRSLRKRDERHGAATGNASYYVCGRPIAQKVAMFGEGFAINVKQDRTAVSATGGNLVGGSVNAAREFVARV